LGHRLTSFTHALYPSWVSFDPSHFAEVFRSLEVVEDIVDRRRCARTMLVVQLRERYRGLITSRSAVTPVFPTLHVLSVYIHVNIHSHTWKSLSTYGNIYTHTCNVRVHMCKSVYPHVKFSSTPWPPPIAYYYHRPHQKKPRQHSGTIQYRPPLLSSPHEEDKCLRGFWDKYTHMETPCTNM